MQRSLARLYYTIVPILVGISLAGCQFPQPSYRKIDRESVAFKDAVADERQRLMAAGATDRKADKLASQRVETAFVKAEATRRDQSVAPLVRVLERFAQPRGCWAYTLTTTRHAQGKVTVDIERFDPFQPEETLWTLLTRDGVAPDAVQQSAYRQRKLRAWKAQQERLAKRKVPEAEGASLSARYSDFAVIEEADGSAFVFTRNRGHIALLGDVPGFRRTYVLNRDGTEILRETLIQIGPASALAGSVKADHFESTTHYAVVDPILPPFPSKATALFRMRVLGKDSGDVQVETIYSDYRRVKCYDDRFEVKIGPAEMIDFAP
jgi:hypothetical protein